MVLNVLLATGGWTSVSRNIAGHSCDEKELIHGLPLK